MHPEQRARRRAFVVDDDPFLRDVTVELLRNVPPAHDVDIAALADGEDARRELCQEASSSSERPLWVFMDVEMPVLDGISTRALTHNAHNAQCLCTQHTQCHSDSFAFCVCVCVCCRHLRDARRAPVGAGAPRRAARAGYRRHRRREPRAHDEGLLGGGHGRGHR